MKVAVIGGTGAMGRAVAKHIAKRNAVIIGSRNLARAEAAAAEVGGAGSGDYLSASEQCDAALFAIPYSALATAGSLAEALSGKLVISMINPLKSEGGFLRRAAEGSSAAEELKALLPRSRVATAFNNIPAGYLKEDVVPPVDVLVAADSRGTYEEVAGLVAEIKEMRPLYAGPLDQARIVEGITALVLNLAKLNGTGALATRFSTRKG